MALFLLMLFSDPTSWQAASICQLESRVRTPRAHLCMDASPSSLRPLIHKDPQRQPLTSECPVSLNLPTFQMGKPRPAQSDVATRPRPRPWSGGFPQPTWPPLRLSLQTAGLILRSQSLRWPPSQAPHALHDPPNPGCPTKVPSVSHN